MRPDLQTDESTLAIHGGRPVRAQFLPVAQPMISEDEIAEVAAVLRSGWIGMGKRTLAFEQAFADYAGAPHAVAVSSCTAALHTALVVAGIGPGDEVITTPLTFAATVNMILACGAKPVLADIDPLTLNLSPDAVARAITPRTKALMPVHFAGLPCDLDALGAVAKAHGLVIIEDAAHAVGAVYGGTRIGGHGNLACFSFYPTKNMTTVEGGMVTTTDAGLAEEMRRIRLHGLSADAWRRFGPGAAVLQEVVRLGFKYNMTDVAAALGLGQLARLESFLATREHLAARYDHELAGLPLDRPQRPGPDGEDRHALHLYVIVLRPDELSADRDRIVDALRAENIGASVHYPPIHQHTYYRQTLGYTPADLPVASSVGDRIISLPLSAAMTAEDVIDVATALRRVLEHFGAAASGTRGA
jgi:dTDP-4-amino-4,6-dideoxygalactose transaminase